MSARTETYALMHTLTQRGLAMSFDDANTLRRAQITLHRWHELECGDGDEYKSWAIERDETSGKPFMCVYPHQGKNTRYRLADREAGAIKRVAEVCKRYGAHYFIQGDPRGCALYVNKEPIADNDYTRGVACCA